MAAGGGGEWPAFVDPAGLVVDPAHGGPAELSPGGAGRRLGLEEGALREWVDGAVRLWLRDGIAAQVRAAGMAGAGEARRVRAAWSDC